MKQCLAVAVVIAVLCYVEVSGAPTDCVYRCNGCPLPCGEECTENVKCDELSGAPTDCVYRCNGCPLPCGEECTESFKCDEPAPMQHDGHHWSGGGGRGGRRYGGVGSYGGEGGRRHGLRGGHGYEGAFGRGIHHHYHIDWIWSR